MGSDPPEDRKSRVYGEWFLGLVTYTGLLNRGGQIILFFHGLHLQSTVDTLQCIADENQFGVLHYGQ